MVTDSLPFTADGRSYSQLYSVILRGYDVPTYLTPGECQRVDVEYMYGNLLASTCLLF